MDEPCSALDPRSTAVIEELIGELRNELAIVIVTHNLQQAHRVGDRVAFMYLGDLVEYGADRAGLRRAACPAHARLRRGCLRVIRAAAPLLAVALALSACQTTQELSAQRAKQAKKLVNQKGLTVGTLNPNVAVGATTIVQDKNGIAAVVELRNTGKAAQAALPVVDRRHRRRRQAALPQRRRRPGGFARLHGAAGQGRGRLLGQQPGRRRGEPRQGPGARRRGRRARSPRRSRLRRLGPAHQSRQDGVFAKGMIGNRSKVAQKRLTSSASRAAAPRRRRRPRRHRPLAGRRRQAHAASPSTSSATRPARSSLLRAPDRAGVVVGPLPTVHRKSRAAPPGGVLVGLCRARHPPCVLAWRCRHPALSGAPSREPTNGHHAGHPRPDARHPGGAVRELRRPTGRRSALLPGVRGAAHAGAWPSARSSPRAARPRRPPVVAAPAHDGPPARSGIAFLGGLLCLLLALGVGVLIGNSGDDAAPAAAPHRRSSRSAARPLAPAADGARGDDEHAGRRDLVGRGRSAAKSSKDAGSSTKRSKGSAADNKKLKDLNSSSGEDYQKKSQKLPKGSGPPASRRPRTTSPPAAARLRGHRMSALDRLRDRRRGAPQRAPAAAPRLQAHAELRARRDAAGRGGGRADWDLGGLPTRWRSATTSASTCSPPRRGAAGGRRRAGRGRAPARRRDEGVGGAAARAAPPRPRRRLLLEVRPAADAPGHERGLDRADGQRQRIALRLGRRRRAGTASRGSGPAAGERGRRLHRHRAD